LTRPEGRFQSIVQEARFTEIFV